METKSLWPSERTGPAAAAPDERSTLLIARSPRLFYYEPHSILLLYTILYYVVVQYSVSTVCVCVYSRIVKTQQPHAMPPQRWGSTSCCCCCCSLPLLFFSPSPFALDARTNLV